MKRKVFIHTNHRQMTGALVSAFSLRRNSAQMLRQEMTNNHLRHDAFQVLERPPRLAA